MVKYYGARNVPQQRFWTTNTNGNNELVAENVLLNRYLSNSKSRYSSLDYFSSYYANKYGRERNYKTGNYYQNTTQSKAPVMGEIQKGIFSFNGVRYAERTTIDGKTYYRQGPSGNWHREDALEQINKAKVQDLTNVTPPVTPVDTRPSPEELERQRVNYEKYFDEQISYLKANPNKTDYAGWNDFKNRLGQVQVGRLMTQDPKKWEYYKLFYGVSHEVSAVEIPPSGVRESATYKDRTGEVIEEMKQNFVKYNTTTNPYLKLQYSKPPQMYPAKRPDHPYVSGLTEQLNRAKQRGQENNPYYQNLKHQRDAFVSGQWPVPGESGKFSEAFIFWLQNAPGKAILDFGYSALASKYRK